jgi:hypothetical protein
METADCARNPSNQSESLMKPEINTRTGLNVDSSGFFLSRPEFRLRDRIHALLIETKTGRVNHLDISCIAVLVDDERNP